MESVAEYSTLLLMALFFLPVLPVRVSPGITGFSRRVSTAIRRESAAGVSSTDWAKRAAGISNIQAAASISTFISEFSGLILTAVYLNYAKFV
jgi:hypothetical protein